MKQNQQPLQGRNNLRSAKKTLPLNIPPSRILLNKQKGPLYMERLLERAKSATDMSIETFLPTQMKSIAPRLTAQTSQSLSPVSITPPIELKKQGVVPHTKRLKLPAQDKPLSLESDDSLISDDDTPPKQQTLAVREGSDYTCMTVNPPSLPTPEHCLQCSRNTCPRKNLKCDKCQAQTLYYMHSRSRLPVARSLWEGLLPLHVPCITT